MPVIPQKAATVILLREKKPEGFEVFLLKRHEKSSFMGGNFVYPGGRVDREDGSMELCSYSRGTTFEDAHRILGRTLSPEESFAHWIAGIRELFEEAGILLAYHHTGNPFEYKNEEYRQRVIDYRDQLQMGKTTICRIAKEANILLAIDQLYYYAHWITPEARPERFDTRFFLARHPEGQEASYDRKETIEGIWMVPRKALEENSKGKMALSPPTLKTLEDLSRYETIEEVFNSLIEKDIKPILPILTKTSNEPTILFPWDPEYEAFQKEKFPASADHGRPSQESDNTTRLILRQGIWYPYCRSERLKKTSNSYLH
jgi:8-oxo-dGTP pyrophosphatase MutT (NUDIX family)